MERDETISAALELANRETADLRARLAAAEAERDQAREQALTYGREADDLRRNTVKRFVGAKTFAEHSAEWLKSNQKQSNEVMWGAFPLGMVGRWIERAAEAEAALAAAREALRAAKIACWDTLNQLDEAGIDAPLLREAIGRLARAVLAVGGEQTNNLRRDRA